MTGRLGIDIGGTSVKAVRVGPDGGVVAATSDRYDDPDDRAIEHAIEQAAGACGPVEAVSVGVCMPGLLDETGTVRACVNLPRLVGVRPVSLVGGALGSLGCHATVGAVRSDAVCAALGYWHDSGRPNGRLLALSLGTGVGVGLLDDGVVRPGVYGLGGHLGQLDVSPAVPNEPIPAAPDGARGTLESYIGWRRLRDTIGEEGLASMTCDAGPLRALAYALRLAHPLYRPDRIVLLGGVGTALGPYLEPMRASVSEGLTSLARPGWSLEVGNSVYHAAVGASLPE